MGEEEEKDDDDGIIATRRELGEGQCNMLDRLRFLVLYDCCDRVSSVMRTISVKSSSSKV